MVRRTIGGQTKRYVERMADRRVSSIAEARFLDSFLVYDGPATATIAGLDHLAGREVGILADGNVLETMVVAADGTVALPRAYAHVVVGLRYDEETYVETLDLDLGAVQGLGTVQGRRKTVPKVTLRVESSREFLAGPDADHLTLTKVRLEEWGATPDLLTGTADIAVGPAWNSHGRVVVKPGGPVPLSILGIAPDIAVGG